MLKTIYLAGGCFWGVEKYMSLADGITETEVGFANGNGENPAYEEVYTGSTGFAETVRVVYDPVKIPLPLLLNRFYEIIDPTTLNRQADDMGSHYRTGIYYTNAEEQPTISASLAELQTQYDKPIVTENLPLINYYPADEYHQKYLDKNPEGYCHIPPSMFEE